MNKFEQFHHDEPKRENISGAEIHDTIELSDQDFISRQNESLKKNEFAYRPPIESEEMPKSLKEKFEIAKKITENTRVIDISLKGKKTSKKKVK